MRSIGQLPTETQAALFRDFLHTQKVESRIERNGEGWIVWVFDEDQVPPARDRLTEFRQEANLERYVAAVRESRARRELLLEEELAARKRTIEVRSSHERPLSRQAPLSLAMIVLCGMAAAATQFGANEPATNQLRITAISAVGQYFPSLPEISSGEFWRLWTPSLLHFDAFHLIGNCYWSFLFGRLLEPSLGRWRYLLLILIIAGLSNYAQFAHVGPNFGGYSGVNAGLFGYVWLQMQLNPRATYTLEPQSVLIFAGWMAICLTGLVGPIANTAHLAGLGVGLLLAVARIVLGRKT